MVLRLHSLSEVLKNVKILKNGIRSSSPSGNLALTFNIEPTHALSTTRKHVSANWMEIRSSWLIDGAGPAFYDKDPRPRCRRKFLPEGMSRLTEEIPAGQSRETTHNFTSSSLRALSYPGMRATT